MANFRLQKTFGTVTAKGKRKVKAIETAIVEAMERTLRRGAADYKRALAKHMPDAVEEAQLLSVGDADIAVNVGTHITSVGMESDVGTPDGGRFLKRDGMLPLRDAIIRSSVTVTRTGPRTLAVVTARDSEINAKSGFSWNTHQRGVQGPTEPFNHNLMQAMNDGGVWEVVPRGGRLLNPDDGVLATRMVKTLQPTHARQLARAEIAPQVHASLTRAIKSATKRASQ